MKKEKLKMFMAFNENFNFTIAETKNDEGPLLL
jgi:hypothetical protein